MIYKWLVFIFIFYFKKMFDVWGIVCVGGIYAYLAMHTWWCIYGVSCVVARVCKYVRDMENKRDFGNMKGTPVSTIFYTSNYDGYARYQS